MIKNSLYTFEYVQPEDYRFSLDSVFLSQKVAKIIEQDPDLGSYKVLDLCAGCGVVGLELIFHLSVIKQVDFLEVQEVYLPYFLQNITQVKDKSAELNFLSHNYADLLKSPLKEKFENSYDIIVSNPPYFFTGEGLMSPNEFKNRCRFFIDSDFKKLIDATTMALKPNGRAYLLVRSGTHHGRNLFNEIKKIGQGLSSVEIIDEVRGTNIIELIKKA
jgi:tRNA1Val (adenine37-N6)-methyltransferase